MKSFLKFVLIALLSSCSLTSAGPDNPEVKEVLVALSNNYLISVVNGNFGEINSVIIWAEYLGEKEKHFSKQKYFDQLSSLDGRYTLDNHPLLKLELEDADISDNHSYLTFRKNNSEIIKLSFMWAESGWLLVDDNLFGKAGLFANLKPISEEEKKLPGTIRQKKLRALDLE